MSTNEENNQTAIERELEELASVAQSFAQLAADARAFTNELNASFARLNKMAQEADIDRKIDELDYQLKRGEYAHLRPDFIGVPEFPTLRRN